MTLQGSYYSCTHFADSEVDAPNGFNPCQTAELAVELELSPLPVSTCKVQDLLRGSSKQSSRPRGDGPIGSSSGLGMFLPLSSHHIFTNPTPPGCSVGSSQVQPLGPVNNRAPREHAGQHALSPQPAQSSLQTWPESHEPAARETPGLEQWKKNEGGKTLLWWMEGAGRKAGLWLAFVGRGDGAVGTCHPEWPGRKSRVTKGE